MLELGVKTLIAYFLGALLGSMIVGMFRKVDIRTMGSGNAGGTNALRTQGMKFGAAVLLIDVAKGAVAGGVLPQLSLPGIGNDPSVSRQWLSFACGAAVILGHVYPLWFDFRGGKGAATIAGVFAAIQPWTLIPMLGAWLAVIMVTGFVGLATMLAGVCVVLAVWWFDPTDKPLLLFSAALSAFIIFTHRSNVARMWQGRESRVLRLWLLRPRSS